MLSLCMIVCDEERHIQRCLEGVTAYSLIQRTYQDWGAYANWHHTEPDCPEALGDRNIIDRIDCIFAVSRWDEKLGRYICNEMKNIKN